MEGPPLPARIRLLLAAVSGCLIFTAFPNWDLQWHAWFGLVPLLIAARGTTVWQGLLLGLVAGTVTNTGGFHWMTDMLEEFGHMSVLVSWPIFGLQAVTQGLSMAVGVGLWRYLVRSGAPAARSAFLAMWAGELAVPMIFPWYLGNGIIGQTVMVQIADLGGVHLVSAMLYASNAAIAELVGAATARRMPALRFVGATAVVVALAALYGLARVSAVDDQQARAPKLKIGLVEGNIGIWEKQARHLGGERRLQTLRNNLLVHQQMSAALQAQGAELIVWPESAYMPYGAIPVQFTTDRYLVVGDAGVVLRHDGERWLPLAAHRSSLPRTSGLLTGLSSPRGDIWRYLVDGKTVVSVTPWGSHQIEMPPGETAVVTVSVPMDAFGRVGPGYVIARSGRVFSLAFPSEISAPDDAHRAGPIDDTAPELIEVPAIEVGAMDVTAAGRSGAGRLFLVGRGGAMAEVAGHSVQKVASPTDKDLWAVAGDPLGDLLVAVGSGGVVLASHGRGWRVERAGDGTDLYAAWCAPDGTMWAGGRGGTLLRRNRRGLWSRVSLGYAVDVLAGACDADGGVLVSGRGGRTFIRPRGGRFKEVATGTGKELTSAVGFQSQAVYAIPRRARRVVPAVAPLPPASLPFPDNVVADEDTSPLDRSTPRRGFTTPLLFGALTHGGVLAQRNAECQACFNSAVLLEPDGRIADIYDKRFLLVFGEYLPFGETWPELYDLLPEGSRFQAGTRTEPVVFGAARIGVLICYEDLLPRHVVRVAAHDPNVFINMTNDAWFGKTAEPYHHLQLAQMRSVEYRRWLIRSTNTGVSVFVDAVGRRVKESSLDDAETLLMDVPLIEGRTVYATLGDWTFAALIVALLLTWARALRGTTGAPAGRGRSQGRAKPKTPRSDVGHKEAGSGGGSERKRGDDAPAAPPRKRARKKPEVLRPESLRPK